MQLQAAFAAAWAEATGELLTGPLFFPAGRLSAGRADARRTAVHGADDREHTGRAFSRAHDQRRAEDAVYRELVLRSRRRFSPAAGARRQARRGRAGAHGEREDRRQDDVVRRPLSLRGAAACRRSESTNTSRRCCTRRRSSPTACGASIGSMNFDNRSMAFNNESNLVVLDSAFGARDGLDVSRRSAILEGDQARGISSSARSGRRCSSGRVAAFATPLGVGRR